MPRKSLLFLVLFAVACESRPDPTPEPEPEEEEEMPAPDATVRRADAAIRADAVVADPDAGVAFEDALVFFEDAAPSPDAVVLEADAGPGAPDADPLPDAAPVSPDAEPLPVDSGFPDAGVPDASRSGLAVLGWGSHSLSQVDLTVISAPANGLNQPRDLELNPARTGELWVFNRRDDSVVIYSNVGTPQQTSQKRIDPYAEHFMEEVSSVSFAGGLMKFGTCQESANTYNNAARPNYFMGPTMWSADLGVFARSNPAAVADLGFDLGSHLDMLHESPYCMGIAWETSNVYWTFDGYTSSISRYDFQQDHGPGYDDHSDGLIDRYVEGQVVRVADVPSHMEIDHRTNLLYIADTGHARIAVLDTRSGTRGSRLTVKEPGTVLTRMTNARLTTLADSTSGELSRPSGLALVADTLYVTDNSTGRITAFSLTGQRLDWLETGLPSGALMGITVDPQGRIYVVDSIGNRVLRISGRP